tara:strand:+ start:967 stop:1173 length:207 start_codon:yes stop_codon:yes gene_type:complete
MNDHHQEMYELNQQNEEGEYDQWELEQQEQEEAQKPKPREMYNAFHDTYTPDVWRKAKKQLTRRKNFK